MTTPTQPPPPYSGPFYCGPPPPQFFMRFLPQAGGPPQFFMPFLPQAIGGAPSLLDRSLPSAAAANASPDNANRQRRTQAVRDRSLPSAGAAAANASRDNANRQRRTQAVRDCSLPSAAAAAASASPAHVNRQKHTRAVRDRSLPSAAAAAANASPTLNRESKFALLAELREKYKDKDVPACATLLSDPPQIRSGWFAHQVSFLYNQENTRIFSGYFALFQQEQKTQRPILDLDQEIIIDDGSITLREFVKVLRHLEIALYYDQVPKRTFDEIFSRFKKLLHALDEFPPPPEEIYNSAEWRELYLENFTKKPQSITFSLQEIQRATQQFAEEKTTAAGEPTVDGTFLDDMLKNVKR